MSESIAGVAGYAPSSIDTAPQGNIPFEFRADGAEYFRIWIVNLLLTIVTLGIYSAWAKVRRMRYFYGNTLLDGQGFDYHARPIQILKGRLIIFGGYVVFLLLIRWVPLLIFPFIISLFFAVPWIIQKARTFQMRVTSHRNLRFNFHGRYGGAMAAFIGYYFLTLITFGILFPKWVYKRVQYTLGNVAYGKTSFRFVTPSGEFFAFCYATVGMSIIAYAAYFVVLYQIGFMDSRPAPPGEMLAMLGVAGVLTLLVIALAGMGIWGFYQARFANAAFGGIELGNARVISTQEAWPLAWIEMTNLLAMIGTLGLFYPWAKVRKMRYQLSRTSLAAPGGLAEFQASPGEAGEALGEELGEFFDVDFGI